MEASHVMVAELLLAHAEPDEAQRAVLEKFARLTIRNVRGTDVGEMRGSDGLRAALRG
jgi:hypothetical protein